MGGIRHTGIYVKDLEKMVKFYTELFSLEIMQHQFENGDYIDTVFNEEGVNIEVYKLKFEDGSLLELIDYKNKHTEVVEKNKLYDQGQTHIAITVDSAEHIYEALAEKKCQILSYPCISADGRVKMFFARDPEGNYLELVEEQK